MKSGVRKTAHAFQEILPQGGQFKAKILLNFMKLMYIISDVFINIK